LLIVSAITTACRVLICPDRAAAQVWESCGDRAGSASSATAAFARAVAVCGLMVTSERSQPAITRALAAGLAPPVVNPAAAGRPRSNACTAAAAATRPRRRPATSTACTSRPRSSSEHRHASPAASRSTAASSAVTLAPVSASSNPAPSNRPTSKPEASPTGSSAPPPGVAGVEVIPS
jgi:hypothetical protein